MFSLAQASVSLLPFPPIPMQAMFNLLLRFCPRKSAGKPNATAPVARELVLINSRRSTRESSAVSGNFREGNLGDGLDTRSEYTAPLPRFLLESLLASHPRVSLNKRPSHHLAIFSAKTAFTGLSRRQDEM